MASRKRVHWAPNFSCQYQNIEWSAPSHQRSAVPILCAAGGEAWTAPAPLDIAGSEGGRGTAALTLPRPQEPGQGGGDHCDQEHQGGRGGHGQHGGDTRDHVAADRADITHLQQNIMSSDIFLIRIKYFFYNKPPTRVRQD